MTGRDADPLIPLAAAAVLARTSEQTLVRWATRRVARPGGGRLVLRTECGADGGRWTRRGWLAEFRRARRER